MDMQELSGRGVSADIIAMWRVQQGERLLPLQERAVREFDLFGSGNLLVQAPTSSGKTFIGEMAAVHAALGGRKAVYLAPLKALAEEKHREFEGKYASLGLRTIICTRDHRAFDAAFERGHFDIAVAVYEKLEQLSVTHPERLRELALVIADELEVLSDPERGAAVELLLTRLRAAEVRLVGLSAVLGDPGELAAWLDARLLEHVRRPVELRWGVLYDGTYRYCGHNDHAEGEESMDVCRGETSWETVSHAVRALAEAGESCLVFVKARREARRAAELLARRLSLPAASGAIESLRTLEPTYSRDALLRTLETGTAFHSADLLPGERRAVESGFRAGEIKALVATSTLAAGMNLPAHNVFLSVDKWVYDSRLDLPWRAPISQAEFENMSGRAGRYGAGGEFGRAVLASSSPFERDSLWRRYIKGRREPVRPQLSRTPLEDPALHLIASRCCRTLAELEAFLAGTLTARRDWADGRGAEEARFRLRAAVRRCIEVGAVRAADASGAARSVSPDASLDDLSFAAEAIGRVIAAKGVSLASTRAALHWLRLSERRDWRSLDLLTALALLPDAGLRQVALSRAEYESADYPGRLKRLTVGEEIGVDVPLNRLRNCRVKPFYDEVRAVKTALFLAVWIEESPIEEIEAEFEVSAGQIQQAADQLSWLADAAATLAEAQSMDGAFASALHVMAERLSRGLRPETLPAARTLPQAPRRTLIALAKEGLLAPERIVKADPLCFGHWLTPEQARALRQWAAGEIRNAEPSETQEETAPAPVLVVDARRPGEIRFKGTVVALQDKQYRLIQALARRPGECIPYEEIYRGVWGEAVVEDNQRHYQKRMLIRRLAEADPECAKLVSVVPKHGFVLNLAPEQVRVIEAGARAA